jgi:uncharacterized protein YndB with AHSA1/START domain
MEKLQIHTALQIARSRNDIFEAIVDPEKMSNYFIAQGSGRMEEGKVVTWSFPEFPDSFPVKVQKVTVPEEITFEWEGQEGSNLQVKITLEDRGEDQTLVKITEGEMEADANGIKWLAQNTAGWANFLACLKAYLEYGINLRKGAFDFMKS